jgi:hypothetical protein
VDYLEIALGALEEITEGLQMRLDELERELEDDE